MREPRGCAAGSSTGPSRKSIVPAARQVDLWSVFPDTTGVGDRGFLRDRPIVGVQRDEHDSLSDAEYPSQTPMAT